MIARRQRRRRGAWHRARWRRRAQRRLGLEPLEARQLLAVAAGPEFAVNTTVSGDQFAAAVSRDVPGRSVVVWDSIGQDGDGHGLFAQRFDSDGQPLGIEFPVNSVTAGDQLFADVAMDADGQFAVVWESPDADGTGVFGRQFDADGNPLGSQFQVNVTTQKDQLRPAIAMADDGRFVVVWSSIDQDGDSGTIVGRRYDANGQAVSGEMIINTTAVGGQFLPDVAISASGQFVVAWESEQQDGDGLGIVARPYDTNGQPVSGEIVVNTTTQNDQSHPSVSSNGDGDFVVAWDNEVLTQHLIIARRFDSTGTAQSGEIQVTTVPKVAPFVPDVALDEDGQFTVVWDADGADGDGDGIVARSFGGNHVALGPEFVVNSTTANDQSFPAIALDGADNFVVVWESFAQDGSGNGIFGQRFFVNDTPTVDLNGAAVPGNDFETRIFAGDPPAPIVSSDLVLSDPDHTSLTGALIALDAIPDGTAESLQVDTTGTSVVAQYDDGTGVLTLTGSDTIKNYQQVLRSLSYQNLSQTPTVTPRRATVAVLDEFDQGTPATVTITVDDVNDPPQVDLNGSASGQDFAATYVEDAAPISIVAPDATVSDVDSRQLHGATIQIAQVLDTGDELLATDTTGTNITASYDAAAGRLQLSGPDSAANYQQVLRRVTYQNQSQDPNATPRLVEFMVSDGNSENAPVTATVDVTPVNDSAILDLNGDGTGSGRTVSFVEDSVPVSLLAEAATLTDADGTLLVSATAQLAPQPDGASETLSAVTDGTNLTVQFDPATGTLSIIGQSDGATYLDVLKTLAYQNTSQDPVTSPRSIQITLNDGQDESPAVTVTVDVTAVNDPPVLDLNGSGDGTDRTVLFPLDEGSVVVAAPDLTVTDADDDTLSGASAVLEGAINGGQEFLTADLTNTNITAQWDPATNTLTLAGEDTILNYQRALRTVRYVNEAVPPSSGLRTIVVSLIDASGAGPAARTEVQIDAPNSSISGSVYADVNNNGVRDATEIGLPNVPVTINGPVVRTVRTDSQGYYAFTDLPAGTYEVIERQPSAYQDGQETQGQPALGQVVNDAFVNIDLPAGTELVGYNFGERGLLVEFVTKQFFLASTPDPDQLAAYFATYGDEGFQFDVPSDGSLTLTAEAEGVPVSLELYSANMLPLVITKNATQLTLPVNQNDTYVLYVAKGEGESSGAIQMIATQLLDTPPVRDPLDVNGDGAVTPIDALNVIEVLNNSLNPAAVLDPIVVDHADANGDGFVAPLDVLLIIHRLNQPATSSTSGAVGEGEMSFLSLANRLPPALPIHPGLLCHDSHHNDDHDWLEMLARDVARVADGLSHEPVGQP